MMEMLSPPLVILRARRSGVFGTIVQICQPVRTSNPRPVSEGNAMSRSLIVLPDDTAKPILDAIAQAQKSIRVKMFLFSDPSLLDAVIAAQHRGVDVRIMLNPERRDGEKENDDSRKGLVDAGVHVIDRTPPFDRTIGRP